MQPIFAAIEIDPTILTFIFGAIVTALVAWGVIKNPNAPPVPTPPVPATSFDAWLTAQGIDPATISPALRATLEPIWRATLGPVVPPVPAPDPAPGTFWQKAIALLLQLAPLLLKSSNGMALTAAESAKAERLVSACTDLHSENQV